MLGKVFDDEISSSGKTLPFNQKFVVLFHL